MRGESTSDPTDRREAARLQMRLPVKFEDGDGWTRDVSASGVYFETDASLTPGAPIKFSLLLEHVYPTPLHLACKGEIVRVERREGTVGVAAAITAYRLLPQGEDPALWNERAPDDRARQGRPRPRRRSDPKPRSHAAEEKPP